MRDEARVPATPLALRPPRAEDAPAIARYCADFDLSRMTSRIPHPYGMADAEAYLAHPEPDGLALAIETPADGLIGMVGWRRLDEPGAAEFGYWLGRPFWGRGLATAAGRATLGRAFGDPAIAVLRAKVFQDNPASARVLEKLGFRRHGAGEGGSVARGEGRWPTWEYALTREE